MSADSLTLHPAVPLPSNWTLLLPSVTIANTPQLSLDLLLTTLPCTHLAHLRAPSVLPFASPAPSIPSHRSPLITALELYQLDATDILVLQQRAPTAEGRALEFATQVVQWAAANGCTAVVMVASSNAAGLRGLRAASPSARSMHGFRYVASTAGLNAPFVTALKARGVPLMETVTGDARGWEPDAMDNVRRDLGREEARIPAFVPSARAGSFVRGVLQCCEKRGLRVGGVVQFVHEGDNGGDARVLASVVGAALGVAKDGVEEAAEAWVAPRAWKDGGAVPVGLY